MNKSLITALKAIKIATAAVVVLFGLTMAATIPGVLYDREHSVSPVLIQTVTSDMPIENLRLIKYKDVTIQQFDSLLQADLTSTIETEVVRSLSDDKGLTNIKLFPNHRGVYLIQSISNGQKNGSVLMYFDENRVNGLIEEGLTVKHADGYFTTTEDGAIHITENFQTIM